MSSQLLGLLSKTVKSITTAFANKAEKDALQALLQDVVDLRNAVDALVTVINANRALYNAHTHAGDGAQAGAFFTGTPVTDATTGSVQAGTASTQSVGVTAAVIATTL